MKFKKIILSLVAQSFAFGAVVFASFGTGGGQSYRETRADSSRTPLLRSQVNATEVTHTKSNNSDTFKFNFATSYESRANKYEQVFLSTLDPNFIESETTTHSKQEDIPHFDGFVSLFVGKGTVVAKDSTHDNKSLVAIPRYVQVTTKYIFDSTLIGTGIVSDESQYSNVFGIFIPKEVTTIEEGAFVNVPADVTLYCEAASKPAGWHASWTDAANVVWGVDVASDEGYAIFAKTYADDLSGGKETLEKNVLTRKATATRSVSTGYACSLGYVGSVSYQIIDPDDATKLKTVTAEFDKPLIVEYEITKKGGSKVAGTPITLGITNTDRGFDGVGEIIGSKECEIKFSIPVEEGDTIDSKSIVFTNVYTIARAEGAKKLDEHGNIIDDPAAPFVLLLDEGEKTIAPSNTVEKIIQLGDLISFKATGFSRFSGYTQVNFDVTNKAKSALKKYSPDNYKEYASDIEKGKYYIRFRFTGLFDSELSIKLKGETEYHNVVLDTPSQYDYLIIGTKASGNKIGFLFKDSNVCPNFDPNNIEDIKFLNMALKAEVVKNDATSTKAAFYIDPTFAIVDVYSSSHDKVGVVDLTLVLFIVIGAYVVLFAAGAVALYFFLKNKFKNDEFRRMNTKRYVLQSVKNFFEFLVVTVAITFVIFRTAIMNSGVVMFNPLDVYVILFSIVALIFVGLTIKDVVVATKRSLDNKKKLRLRIDEDKVEDGTN